LIAPTLLLLVVLVLAWTWHDAGARHRRVLDRLDVRVHVNGIRGKSSVTRLVAAVLREGGYVTVAKTTGSAARVIGPTGEETPIARRGAATVNEQIEVISRHVTPDIEALVIECMAVNPIYQRYAQESIVRGDITIITNVREDHQEVMGETLEQIADSLSVTIPREGVLISAEDRPHLQARLARNAAARQSEFVVADAGSVTDADMVGFGYFEFRENVAIGFEVARLLGIDREVALRGMWKAVPDVGALQLAHLDIGGKDVLWVPLFASNDRESVVAALQGLRAQLAGRRTIGILNNRADRGRRAELFADMVATDLEPFLDHVLTFGAFESVVTERLVRGGYDRGRITNMGESVDPTIVEILDTINRLLPGGDGALIGLVNIHTAQAELLLHHFGAILGTGADDGLGKSREPWRWPATKRRHARAVRPRDRRIPIPIDA
jgi:poly-gamma-glutamate synthase PgsB/CapB